MPEVVKQPMEGFVESFLPLCSTVSSAVISFSNSIFCMRHWVYSVLAAADICSNMFVSVARTCLPDVSREYVSKTTRYSFV
jgi:hypothetical protein